MSAIPYRRASPLPWPKEHGKALFSILLMPLVMGHMAHLGMALKTIARAKKAYSGLKQGPMYLLDHVFG